MSFAEHSYDSWDSFWQTQELLLDSGLNESPNNNSEVFDWEQKELFSDPALNPLDRAVANVVSTQQAILRIGTRLAEACLAGGEVGGTEPQDTGLYKALELVHEDAVDALNKQIEARSMGMEVEA